MALKASTASTGYPAVITLTFPVVSSFNCTVEFGDGVMVFASSPRFHAIMTSNVTHVYNTDGLYNVSAMCRNRINTCNASTTISVQYSIQGLTVNPIMPYVSRHGSDIEVKWTIAQGSNVKYQAKVDNNTDVIVITSRDTKQGNATITQRHYGSVGRHSVTITASNDVTKPVHVTRLFEVMYPIPSFNVTLFNTKGYFMVYRPINITITQATEHDVDTTPLYTIDFGDGSPRLLLRNVSVSTYTYVRQGCYTVNVTCSNEVSSTYVVRSVCIEKGMNPLEGLSVNSKPAKLNDDAVLYLHLNNGSDFTCTVRFSDGMELTTAQQHSLFVRVQRRFTRIGTYDVMAKCWNEISLASATGTVTVQKPVKGLVVYPIQPVVFGHNFTVRWNVTQGTNVTCNVTFMSRNIAYNTDGSRAAVITTDMYSEEGTHSVTVTVHNQVTQPITLTVYVFIEKLLFGLKIDFMYFINNIEYHGFGKTKTGFPLGVPVSGKAVLVSQSKYVNYSYHLDGALVESWENKQVFSFPAMTAGIHNISVTAVNNVSGINYTVQLFFQEKVEFRDRTLLCTSPVVIGNKARIRLSVGAVPSDSCLFIHVTNDTTYHYGNQYCSQFTTNTTSVSRVFFSDIPSYVDMHHFFKQADKTLIKVELTNLVSMDTLTCEVDVLLIACTYPVISLQQINRALSKPRVVKRSESLDVHSEINVFCPASEGTLFEWKVYKIDETTNRSHIVNYTTRHNLPSFHIEKRTLQFGLHRVSLTVRMSESALQEFSSKESGYVKIIPSDLVAKIEGGTTLRRGMGPDLKIDGSSSYDPDVGMGNVTGIRMMYLHHRHRHC